MPPAGARQPQEHIICLVSATPCKKEILAYRSDEQRCKSATPIKGDLVVVIDEATWACQRLDDEREAASAANEKIAAT
jgi:hypothetical protein